MSGLSGLSGLSALYRAGASDVTAPTLEITLSQYAFKIGETGTVTFTFSEAPVGFTSADVTVQNGTLSSFGVTGNPLVYTATFTPNANTADATNVITVGTDWTDEAGNPPVSSTISDNYEVDTVAPTVTSVEVQTGLTVDVTFSEAMGTGVTTASNYTVSGTGKGSLADNPNSVALVSGNKYRLTWDSGEMLNGGNITITVANVQDAAGNTIGSPNSGTHTGGAIGTAPTCVITCSQTSPSAVTPLNFTFTFSESVTGFTVDDITASISGGSVTKSNFAGSGSVYTCDLAPSVSGTMTVDVADNVCVDGAGNPNTAATQFVINVIVYQLNDTFTTDDDTPLTSPRNCEPGPNTFTIVDTDGRLSISGGRLIAAGARKSGDDPRIYSAALTRANGLTFKMLGGITNTVRFGFGHNVTSMGLQNYFTVNGNNLFFLPGNPGVMPVVAGNDYQYALVLRNPGAYYLVKGGAYTDWTLLWVDASQSTSTLYAMFGANDGDVNSSIDYIRVAQIGGGFETQYGIATQVQAVVTAGDQITHTANAVIEFTWTAVTNEVLEFDVRRTDADNRWIIRCDQAGSTIKLIERNGGSETERSSAAQTWTNGTSYRIGVVCYGNIIRSVVGTTNKNSYTSASFNNTATVAKVNKNGTNLISYPCAITGDALLAVENL